VASRRRAEEMIAAGRVAVNGEVVREMGVRVDAARDSIAVDGRPLPPPPRAAYFALNKPPGVISSARDSLGRQTVVDLIPGAGRLYPVGRLDADSAGLVLLTNDGELAHGLTHPRFGVPKVYAVEVSGVPGAAALTRLRNGVELDDGLTAPAGVELVEQGAARVILRITIREGRKRQVRRMLDAVGCPVQRLTRVAIGPLRLGDLKRGAWRPLTGAEVAALRSAVAAGGRRPGARPPRAARAPRGAGTGGPRGQE